MWTGLLEGFKLLLDLSLQLELSMAANCHCLARDLAVASEQNEPKSKQLGLEVVERYTWWKLVYFCKGKMVFRYMFQ